MKKLFIYSLFLLLYFRVAAQSTFDFESTTVPSQWTGMNGTVLSVDDRHTKDGTKSLKCTLPANGMVRLTLSAQTSSNRIVVFPVYSEVASNDTLVFLHYDSNGTLRQKGHMVLNFTGWRPYHRHLYHDFGGKGWYGYKRLDIVYRPKQSGAGVTIWMDNVNAQASYSGVYQQRVPGPQDIVDYQAGQFVGDYTDLSYLEASIHTVPAAPESSSAEQTDYNIVKQQFTFGESYIRSSSSAADARVYLSEAKCNEAKTFVGGLNLQTMSDGSVNGKGIAFPLDPNTVLQYSFHVLALSYGVQSLQDDGAKTMLLDFTRYLIDQGIAFGGPVYLANSNYSVSRQFLLGFLHAIPVYRNEDEVLADRVEEMLRYTYNYGQVYGPLKPGLSTDYIHIKSKFLFALADLRTGIDEKVRDVHAIKKLYEDFTDPTIGVLDGIKPDGTGYHHNAMHNAYMYAFSTWISDMFKLYQTEFRVSEEAYRNVHLFNTSHYLQTANDGSTAFYANASCGRAPFSLAAKVTKGNLDQFKTMGSLYSSETVNKVNGMYNYFFTPQSPLVEDLDGFHQLNYGMLGIYRRNDWVASMRGLSSQLWGTEIYDGANVFGRYQSYGSLEIMYNGSDVLKRSGYPSSSSEPWDWNVIPGTTTVHLDWKKLAPNTTRADEYQSGNFAGSVSAGKTGVFALEFVEKANYYTMNLLTFRKSVFATDDLLICLGSGISSGNQTDRTATNLFQTILSASTGDLYVDSQTASPSSLNTTLAKDADHWLVNPSGTAYFIPSGNDQVTVFRGNQTSPNQNNKYNAATFTTATNQAAKAWIDHGTYPYNKKYHFVVAPGTSPAVMPTLAPSLHSGGGIYTILVQQTNAHIVRFDQQEQTAYAVFSRYQNLTEGPVKTLENPCLMVADESKENHLTLHVCSPDLVDEPSTVELLLKDEWKLPAALQNVQVTIPAPGETRVVLTLKQGLKTTVELIKKSSSLIDDPDLDAFSISYNSSAQMICIFNSSGKILRDVCLMDISGRILKHWQNLASQQEQLFVPGIPSGVYLLSLQKDSGQLIVRKISVK